MPDDTLRCLAAERDESVDPQILKATLYAIAMVAPYITILDVLYKEIWERSQEQVSVGLTPIIIRDLAEDTKMNQFKYEVEARLL